MTRLARQLSFGMLTSDSNFSICKNDSGFVLEFCSVNASQVYIEMNQPVMAASLCLELGNALKVGSQLQSVPQD